MVKGLPAVQETWVRSPGWEDLLEEEMATHSSILAWKNPMAGGAWQATVPGVAKSRTRLSTFTFTCPHTLSPLLMRPRTSPRGSLTILMKTAQSGRDLAEARARAASFKVCVPDFKSCPLITFLSQFSLEDQSRPEKMSQWGNWEMRCVASVVA